MTVFFNLENLEAESFNDYTKFIKLLHDHSLGRLPKLTTKRTLHGKSYILNPTPLFERTNVDILYKIQYIKLAARRDYVLYKLYKFARLDLSFFPDINVHLLTTNPLLKIDHNQIQFLYEERKKENGTIIHKH
jgi:hypothetical protein